MKKFTVFLLPMLFCLFLFSGCEQNKTLDQNVSELKCDVFMGESENYALKASYGFKEIQSSLDDQANNKIYALTFRLLNVQTDDVSYSVLVNYNGTDYKSEFKLNPVSHSVTANVEIENFNLKEFNASIFCASKKETVKMQSILPEGTITYSEALNYLQQNQADLLNNYTDEDGNFAGKIHTRVLVKDDKPYWYVGLISKDDNLKALLIDGFTGEVLAIREVL